jgi:hypothetical protein
MEHDAIGVRRHDRNACRLRALDEHEQRQLAGQRHRDHQVRRVEDGVGAAELAEAAVQAIFRPSAVVVSPAFFAATRWRRILSNTWRKVRPSAFGYRPEPMMMAG